MSGIFISYRRSGARQTAYRLKDKLKQVFGEDKVFLDLEDIRAGARFADVINDAIGRASVVLIVIGPNWLEMASTEGGRRLDEEDDWVRQEVEVALRSKAEVIPLLVDGATQVTADQLPESMRDLASLNFHEISPKETHWHFDTDRLITEIGRVDPGLEHDRPKPKLPLSQKAIWALIVLALVLIGIVGEDDVDHDTIIGGIAMAVLALVLAIWAFFDVKAEKVRGKAAAISGMVLGGLGTLGAIGSLSEVGPTKPVGLLGPSGPSGPILATKPNRDPSMNGGVEQVAAAAAVLAPSVDLSGLWSNTEGMRYRVRQSGKTFEFSEFDTNNNVTATGTGTIDGRRITYEFQSSLEGPGHGVLVLSQDGQTLTGTYNLLISGESGASALFRQ